jgi:trehalose 6-phosphate phosphatase
MVSLLPPPPPDMLTGAALFLDFDGTLVELADTPSAIEVTPALEGLLKRLGRRLDGRLAILSGRSLADLDRYIDCHHMFVSGSHGIERRHPGELPMPLNAPSGLEATRTAVTRFAEGRRGLLVEHKPAGVALHYRLAPEEEAGARALMNALAEEHGMIVQRGNQVVELRPRGADKGDALRAIMAEPAFHGARPVFVGDDLTDEHGFEAAAALGGAGILVGPDRPTAARFRLADVAAVSDWLGRAA